MWNSATRRWTKSLQFLVIPQVLHFGRKRARQPHLKTPLFPPQLSGGGGTNSLWWKLVNCDRNSIRGSRNEDVDCLFIHAGENQNVRIAWILLQPSLLRVYVTGVAASRRKEVKHPQFAHLCISRSLTFMRFTWNHAGNRGPTFTAQFSKMLTHLEREKKER